MKVIKVGIIDDDGSKVTQMMAYLLYGMKDASKQKADRYSNVRFEVLEIPLSADMNDIAEYIIDEKIDALLIDYNLASYATVPYTGVQLARYIQERFMEFPLFILTSYEDTERYIGRKADKNRKIYNGMIKAYIYQFLGPKPPKMKR